RAGGAEHLWAGLSIGVVAGAALGFALYAGLLRIPMRHFFGVTNAMLVLLAAGLASTAARYLIQADLLPAWGHQLWDSSWLLGNGSLLGQTAHILVGYDAQPAGMQLVFYASTLAALWAGARLIRPMEALRQPR
ncbi:iron permease, partial [Rhodanobacter denitrificans]|nr:iron permease [Rhodanobacter denitrificans]